MRLSSTASTTPTLTAIQLPAGITLVTALPVTIPSSGASVILQTTATLAAGNYTLTLNAAAGAATTAANVTATVATYAPPSFFFPTPLLTELGVPIGGSARMMFSTIAWVFGPLWSILYLLMAVAAWLVWRPRIYEDVWLALALFVAQLTLNGFRSFVFFGLRRPGAALVEIVVLFTAIAMTAMRFADFSRVAFWLMTPYGTWVLYASYLNFGIWRMNKGIA